MATTKAVGAQREVGPADTRIRAIAAPGQEPHAADRGAAAAGILLRLGQDDLLGKIKAPVIGPFFQAMSAAGGAVLQPRPAVRRRCGDRLRPQGRRFHGALGGGRLPGDAGRVQDHVAVRPGRAGRQGRGPAQINYSVLGGIVVGLITAFLFDRYHPSNCRRISASSAAGGSCPSPFRVTTLVVAFAMSYFYPIFDAGLTSLGKFIGGPAHWARVHLRVRQPHADSRWAAPHSELIRLVHLRQLHQAGRRRRGHRRAQPVRRRRPDRRAAHRGFYPILMFGLPPRRWR